MADPSMDKRGMRLSRIYLKSGDAAAELDGEGLSLADPLVRDLLSRVFSGRIDPADQAKVETLTTELTDSAGALRQSVETNTPKT